MSKPRVIYWFRTDLRLHDSPALKAALDLKPEVLYPIWCWDSHYVYHTRVGPNRFQFLIDCQNDVSQAITKLNKKSKLFVLREPAVTLLPKLFKSWNITHLVFEKDTDSYAQDRDKQVVEAAEKAGVKVIVKSGRTLWDSHEIVKANGGKPTMTIHQLQAAGEKLGKIAPVVDTPKTLPDPGKVDFTNFKHTQPDAKPDINEEHRDREDTSFSVGIAGPNGDFAAPTLEELGMPAATTPHKGGESVILARLEEILADEDYTATFEKPKTSPAAFEPQSTFLTSPYLHFGALSCRYFYHRVDAILQRRRAAKKPSSSPPTSLHGQLLFRDMYFGAQAALGHPFHQIAHNPTCRFIPWHLPSKLDPATGHATAAFHTDSATAATHLHRWTYGRTGFPWIDAIMRQLRHEGWIHHLARHSVACFLTRGGCYVSWERGAAVFESWLIDHEAACNAGNWQWLSCSAFFAQFYRCYSPVAFGKKWDPEGAYVRKYVPELKDMPAKWIYEPHKAPIADQKKAGVRIVGDSEEEGGEEKGEDGLMRYPKPMFDFAERREVCIQGLKAAYDVGLYGNDPKVLDGSWKALFDDAGEGPTEGNGDGPADVEGGDEGEEVGQKDNKEKKEQSGKGRKRERGQSTLDGAFDGRKKAKG